MADDRIVAVVDDDLPAQEATVDLVRALGFNAVGFGSATELLDWKDLRRMACLITDVRMPGMGGIDLHAQLAASAISVPTILVTAHPDDRTRVRALQAGVDFYLEKPLEADRLLVCICSAIGDRSEQADGSPQGA